MRELLLLRHGITEANQQHIYAGAMDVPLCEEGTQALADARGQYPQAVRFFTSGMLRARQTLQILYGDVAHTDIPALAEYRMGAFEGRSHDALYASEPLYRAWVSDGGDRVVCPGGESRQGFAARVGEGWHTLIAAEWSGLAVLVTHGGVIVSLLEQFAPSAPPYVNTPNGGGWRIALDSHGGITAYEAWGSA